MTLNQNNSVQEGNPFAAKDGKPKLIPEIKQKMRAGDTDIKQLKLI